MAKKPVVYQANPLIEGRRDFSLIEFRLFYLGLRDLLPRLTEKDVPWRKGIYTEFPTTVISPKELVDLFGNRKYYSALTDVCGKLVEKTITIRDADGKGFTAYPVFAELSYKKSEGLRLEFNPKMIPWLLDLAKKPFTKIPFEQIWALTSPYSMRLLELLLQYQNTKTHERTLTVEEIRACFGMAEDAYIGRMNNFRQRVVDFPVKDINAKTSYKVEHETVKEGRRVVAFKFKLYLPEEIERAKRHEQLEALQRASMDAINGKKDTAKEPEQKESREKPKEVQERIAQFIETMREEIKNQS